MAYVIEQKIKERIYLYKVTSYWDKEKKQSRQKRKYLGPKNKIYKKDKNLEKESNINKNITTSKIVSKSYGDSFFIRSIQNKLGLTILLKEQYTKDYKEILSLSHYLFQESTSSYLFPYWQDDHDNTGEVRKLHSTNISSLYERIGKNEYARLEFLRNWGNHIKPTEGVYYDITSVSSYSKNIDILDFGYNRDKEYLPQINIGLTHCIKSSLPLSYRTHSGSIVDVSTLKNTIELFEINSLKKLFFILDRGFCSVGNIKEMCEKEMSFIQPLSFSLKLCKLLVLKHQNHICSPSNAFQYKDEIFYHKEDEIEIDKLKLKAHIYFNEKASIAYKHHLYKTILELEKKFKIFKNKEESESYYENNIQNKYQKYFKVEGKKIVRNQKEIDYQIHKSGIIIFVVHGKKINQAEILSYYKNRDKIEKEINTLKNHIDTKRLRSHNGDTANGRLLVKFISLIQYSYILRILKEHETLKKYTLNEIMFELKKLKINRLGKDNAIISELTKKQKLIFKAFDIDLGKFPSN